MTNEDDRRMVFDKTIRRRIHPERATPKLLQCHISVDALYNVTWLEAQGISRRRPSAI